MTGADRNYMDIEQSGIDSTTERIGDTTGEPPTNEAMDRNKAAKMANLLEGLEFPATKEKIRIHPNARSSGMGNRIDDIVKVIENSLDINREYHNAYNVEVAAGLVAKKDEGERSYVKSDAPNRANPKRWEQSERPNSYTNRSLLQAPKMSHPTLQGVKAYDLTF
ncbi:MAG: hypothetical protein M3270_08765 [Thermoproteota archaeon]|nr:hypothetical protein [Thermoproteota archaeon]